MTAKERYEQYKEMAQGAASSCRWMLAVVITSCFIGSRLFIAITNVGMIFYVGLYLWMRDRKKYWKSHLQDPPQVEPVT